MVKNHFPQLLKKARRQQAWTQQVLAEKLNISRVTINRWESGKNMPSLYWRGKICELFHKQIEELFPETFPPVDTVNLTMIPAKEERDILPTDGIEPNIQNQKSTWVLESTIERTITEISCLELRKKIIECVVDVANKMIVDVLDPWCDVETRSYAIEKLLMEQKYTHEASDQEILLPTMDDVRRALEFAKQTIRHVQSSQPAFEFIQEQRVQTDASERARCSQVVMETTSAQRKVLEAFSKGLRPQQVAAELGIELVTVHTHKTVLLRLCRNTWNIASDEHLDYHFLHTKFASYFENRERFLRERFLSWTS